MAWPTVVQTNYSTGSLVAAGTAFSLASNATVGNTVIVGLLTTAASTTMTSTFGTPILIAASAGNATSGFETWWAIPVTVAGNLTVTPTNGGSYLFDAAEYPGAVNAAVTASGPTVGTNPALTLTVASGTIARVMLALSAGVPTALTITGAGAGTWTRVNAGAWTWANTLDFAVCTNSTGSNTLTWTQGSSSTWVTSGVVLTRALPVCLAAHRSPQRVSSVRSRGRF